jgi:hypothetical protein
MIKYGWISLAQLGLAALLFGFSATALSAEETDPDSPDYKKTEADIVMYDDIVIDRPIEQVWPQVLNFIHWYFDGQDITHIEGEPGQRGYTLRINDNLLHQAISVRPGKSIVWKTCYINTCDKDVVFSDFEVQRLEGKTRFLRRSYSQHFWAEEFADQFLTATRQGKVPVTVRDLSQRFKRYVESQDQ